MASGRPKVSQEGTDLSSPPCMPFKWPLSYVQPVTVANAPLTAVLLCSIVTCCVTTADVENAFKMFSKLGCGKVY